MILSKAEAICSNDEPSKASYAPFSIYSMAQTRATGKAYRLALGWIMKLAGYESTPAEEMDFKPPTNNHNPPMDADYTKKTNTKKSDVLNKEQEKELSKNKIVNEAINRLATNNKKLNKEGLVSEVQNLLVEKAITTQESKDDRKLIMKT